jgi:hypothetical protein
MNTVTYRKNLSADTTRGPSPNIWANCPVLDILEDPGLGMYFFDDFLNFSKHVSAQNVQQYASYIDTGVTIQSLPLIQGVLEVAGNDADNDEGSITTGGNTGTLAVISDTAGDDKKLWFEARIKKASIADNACAFFVGLSEEALAAADTLVDDTAEIASKDMIGFRVKQDNGEELDFVYRKAGQAVQEVIAAGASMVADTYIKVGFVYDPNRPAANRIAIFINGVEQTTYVTATNIAAATFPDAEELALLLATKVGAAAESKFQMDWWRLVQLY